MCTLSLTDRMAPVANSPQRHNQGCGVAVPPSPGFALESESLIWRRPQLRALSVSSGLLCNFVALYLTFVQFILKLKLCLYTTVHLVLEEFKISLWEVILKYTISMSHYKSKSQGQSMILGPESKFRFSSAGVESGVAIFSNPGVGVGVPQKTRTQHPWARQRWEAYVTSHEWMKRLLRRWSSTACICCHDVSAAVRGLNLVTDVVRHRCHEARIQLQQNTPCTLHSNVSVLGMILSTSGIQTSSQSYAVINQLINTFIMRHGTEVRATVRITPKQRLMS